MTADDPPKLRPHVATSGLEGFWRKKRRREIGRPMESRTFIWGVAWYRRSLWWSWHWKWRSPSCPSFHLYGPSWSWLWLLLWLCSCPGAAAEDSGCSCHRRYSAPGTELHRETALTPMSKASSFISPIQVFGPLRFLTPVDGDSS